MSACVTLQEIFVACLDRFFQTHRKPLHVHKAAAAIRHCRTQVLGGHVMACPEGHVEKAFYNSCGHRACPKCTYLKIQKWLEAKRHRLLDCDHFHLTFTLPSELYYLWRYNYAVMADLFFRSVKETIFKLLADPKHMGGLPGLYMNLHTWNRVLALCPHLHVLCTGGGLAPDGTWMTPKRIKTLLSTDVMRQIFKAKFRDGFRRLLKRGQLTIPPDMNENDVHIVLQRALRHSWIVDRRERYTHGRGVLTYLGRYLRGGPLKERRILAWDGENVTFRKSRRNEPFESRTLSADDFIESILRHVPPHNFRMVRGCGLYAPTAAEKRRLARAALGQSEEVPDEAPTGTDDEEADHHDRCEVCGRKLVLVARIPRPPPRPPPAKRPTIRRSSV